MEVKTEKQEQQSLGEKELASDVAHVRQKDGIALIASERQRQISQEDYTALHDDGHIYGELAELAAIYAFPTAMRKACFDYFSADVTDWFKPCPKSRIRELEKAGALIAAEIDRLLRITPSVELPNKAGAVSDRDSSPGSESPRTFTDEKGKTYEPLVPPVPALNKEKWTEQKIKDLWNATCNFHEFCQVLISEHSAALQQALERAQGRQLRHELMIIVFRPPFDFYWLT